MAEHRAEHLLIFSFQDRQQLTIFCQFLLRRLRIEKQRGLTGSFHKPRDESMPQAAQLFFFFFFLAGWGGGRELSIMGQSLRVINIYNHV